MNRFYYNLPILLLLLFTSAAQSATYFIDYVGGADANNGTSTNTPWKTHPYMVNSAVSGYSHAAGDRFIFKGGVTWPINTTGAVKPHAGGTVASPDYNGVTNNWYAGTGWNPPRFDGGDVDTEGFDLFHSGILQVEN